MAVRCPSSLHRQDDGVRSLVQLASCTRAVVLGMPRHIRQCLLRDAVDHELLFGRDRRGLRQAPPNPGRGLGARRRWRARRGRCGRPSSSSASGAKPARRSGAPPRSRGVRFRAAHRADREARPGRCSPRGLRSARRDPRGVWPTSSCSSRAIRRRSASWTRQCLFRALSRRSASSRSSMWLKVVRQRHDDGVAGEFGARHRESSGSWRRMVPADGRAANAAEGGGWRPEARPALGQSSHLARPDRDGNGDRCEHQAHEGQPQHGRVRSEHAEQRKRRRAGARRRSFAQS